MGIKQLKDEILLKVIEYYKESQRYNQSETNKIDYAGRVYDQHELVNLVDASLDFWLTSGKYVNQFEKEFSEFFNVGYSLMVNSGSSANLLAFMCLTSHTLGAKRIERGDEIITVSCGFPTTISPILQYGAVPVFVDVEKETLNINIEEMKKALTSKTKAVMVAHTLGNPFDIIEVKKFCEEKGLWLIEDCADALVSKIDDKYLGTFGDIGTTSLFPAHFMTSGEGGVCYTNNDELFNIMRSMRDWGRDYKCNKCIPNCKKRYNSYNNYDCRYTYKEIGYNLKNTEMGGAIALAQLKKLPNFIKKRKENYNYLYEKMEEFSDYFIFPKSLSNSDVTWFCFPIILKENLKFSRQELLEYLNSKEIDTRVIFSGNIVKQPLFYRLQENKDYKIIGELQDSQYIMDNGFFVGNYPKLKNKDFDYIKKIIKEFINEKTS